MQISSRLSLAAFLAARTYGSVILTNIPQPLLFLPRNTVLFVIQLLMKVMRKLSFAVSTRAFPFCLRICRSVRLHQSAREHDAHNEKKFKTEFMQPPSTAALRARNRILLRRTTHNVCEIIFRGMFYKNLPRARSSYLTYSIPRVYDFTRPHCPRKFYPNEHLRRFSADLDVSLVSLNPWLPEPQS